ncbi:hypothetical protein [Shewanella maritima]|uniref:hypothetical protein n=1 Tax=Shewanella maritima TaxID=2520507 RepID=UPI003736AEBD
MASALSTQPQKVGRKIIFVIMVVGIVLLGTIFLKYFAERKGVWELDCQANAYGIDMVNEIGNKAKGNVLLKLTVQDKQLMMTYYSAFDEHIREYAIFNGELKELIVGAMTYEIDFMPKEMVFSEHSRLKPYLLSELSKNEQEIVVGSRFTQAMRVLEMDSDLSYVIIKFSPSNNIWACSIPTHASE